jgi:hypothetical protein
MKRINLTENDIFNIVNRVISEQKVNQPKEPLSPDDLKKRFLYGDNKAKVKVPAIKGMTFNINDKRGLRKEMIQFVVEDVEFRDTNSKNGTTALIKGYIKEEGGSKQQLTVFEYVCGRFGDFVLKEYKGLDENDIKKQKTPKPQQDDSESSFKNNVKQGITNFKDSQGIQNIKQKVQDVTQNVQGKIKQGVQDFKQNVKDEFKGATQGIGDDVKGKVQGVAQDVKGKVQGVAQDVRQGGENVKRGVQNIKQGVQNVKNRFKPY